MVRLISRSNASPEAAWVIYANKYEYHSIGDRTTKDMPVQESMLEAKISGERWRQRRLDYCNKSVIAEPRTTTSQTHSSNIACKSNKVDSAIKGNNRSGVMIILDATAMITVLVSPALPCSFFARRAFRR